MRLVRQRHPHARHILVAMSDPPDPPSTDAPPGGDAPPGDAVSREGSFRDLSGSFASASSGNLSGKITRMGSMRRTPLSRFASVGRKAGKLSIQTRETLQKTRDKADYRRDILSKPSEERTESDILSLMEILGRLRFAKSLRHAEKVEVCKAMGYRSTEKDMVVFNQGDLGNTFYIILSGSVSVSIKGGADADHPESASKSKSGHHSAGTKKLNPEKFSKVATLYNGDSFGELALLQEGSVRSATVQAETDVEFLVISRDDYNRILGAVSEEQLAVKIKFLHGLPAFAGVPASMIRSAAYVLTTREYVRNAVVYKQGEETEEIFFVESGSVKFVREILDDFELKKLGVLRDGPVAAARIARREKGGFLAEPPPPPGEDDTARETIDEFSHLDGTNGKSFAGSKNNSRPRTPNHQLSLGDMFTTAATEARKRQQDEDERKKKAEQEAAEAAANGDNAENEDTTANEGNTPKLDKSKRVIPTLGETPLTGDTPNASFNDTTPFVPTLRKNTYGGNRTSKGNFSTFKTSSSFGAEEDKNAQKKGLGRLFLEAGRVGALDYFGDVLLTSKLKQPASAITTEPTRCFVLNKWDMLKRVDRDVVHRFRSAKTRVMKFYANEDAILAEFKRAAVWDSYKKSLVAEVVVDRKEKVQKGRA